ncbi:MAG: serine/threonine protein kinase [Planctomycetaceae bacterium]|nr:serine/threonine protein kinase [Planctomycetaceae bacterium]
MPNKDDSLAMLVQEFAALWKSGANPELAPFLERVPEVQQAEAARLLIAVMVEGRAAGVNAGAAPLSPQTSDPLLGTLIDGKYKLIEVIGQGGMGSVYLAEQTQPVRRLVAVKVVKSGMDSRAVLARFEAERQALAIMDHPNIAKVLDAGATDLGQPYFVMELVKGTPITQFCDEKRLTPQQRLELFLPVCEAIQHSHQKGIIHRDIKPSNVLVAMYDDHPVPKVIDFGVAKATGQSLTDLDAVTGFGALVGTPEYMSPEQASLNNLDIDTRSDVYSLGVLLYELLTGHTPVDRKCLAKAAVLEVLRIVRDVDAPRLSEKLSSIDTLPSVAANRRTEPRKLATQFRGDLDWVLMKALEKDRKRRYESASGFAADVHRFLNNEPVIARPTSWWYRTQKFVRKHRVGVVAASLVALAGICGILGTSLALVRALRAEADANASREQESTQRQKAEQLQQLAESRRQEAETNLAFARQGNKILGSVFAKLNPQADYYDVSDLRTALQDNLNQAVQELQASALGNTLEIAKMQETLGDSLLSLGDSAKAIELFQSSLKVHTDQLGPNDPQTLTSMDHLAQSYFSSGQLDQALPMFEETLELRKKRLGPEHEDTLRSMNNLAQCYHEVGQPAKALLLLEQTVELMKVKLGPQQSATMTAMGNLGQAYMNAGQTDKGLSLLEQVLELRKTELGDNHMETLTSMANLASGYFTVGQLDKALPLFEQNMEQLSAQLGIDHPFTVTAIGNLSQVYSQVGEADKALLMLEQVLNLRTAKLGADHPRTLVSLSNLAEMYFSLGQVEKALPLFEQALELRKAKLGLDHPDTLTSINGLAVIYNNTPGKREQALALYEQALELSEAKLGADHPATLLAMNNYAVCCKAAGQLDKALALFEKILPLRQAKLGLEHADTLSTMNHLAEAYRNAKRFDLALELQQKTWELRRDTLGADDPLTLNSLNNLATVYRDAGQPDKAVPLYEQCLELRKAKLGIDHESTITSMNNLGAGYTDLGQMDKAVPMLEQALELRTAKFGANHTNTRNTQTLLLQACAKAGLVEKYRELLEASILQWRNTYPENSPEFAAPLSAAGLTLLQMNQYSEAEKLLRECVQIRQAKQPDLWNTFAAQSMLGAALLGQVKAGGDEAERAKRLTEAESLLLAGYEGMKQREASIPTAGAARIPETLDSLIALYKILEKPDQAERYRELRATYPPGDSQ